MHIMYVIKIDSYYVKIKIHINMYVPGKGIVEGVEEEGVMAMSASDPAHPRHLKVEYF